MKPLPLQVRLVPKPLALSRFFQRPAPPVAPAVRPRFKLSVLTDSPPRVAEVRYLPVWFGAQVVPLPVIKKSGEVRPDFYDD